MGPGPRFEPESRDPQSPRITKLPYPGHDVSHAIIHLYINLLIKTRDAALQNLSESRFFTSLCRFEGHTLLFADVH